MDEALIKKSLNEIISLNERKQFMVAEKKARGLLTVLKPENQFKYKAMVDVSLQLAESLSRNAKNVDAINVLEKLHLQFPFESKILSILFNLYMKLKKLNDAERVVKRWVELEPDEPEGRIKLLRIYLNKHENIQAIIELKKIIGLGIVEPWLYKLLLALFDQEKIYSEKLKQVKLLREIKPDDTLLLVEEIRTLFAMKQYHGAFDLLDSYIDFKFENKQLDLELIGLLTDYGSFYLKLGHRESLGEYFSRLFPIYSSLAPELRVKLEALARKFNYELLFNFFISPELFIRKEKAPFILKLKPENPGYENIIYNIMLIKKLYPEASTEYLNNFLTGSGLLKYIPDELINPLVYCE
jgi:tetratricopeptide (TPR) repeat protein